MLAKVKNAYYIKLGRGGKWEQSSISQGILRFGWRKIFLDQIAEGDWPAIEGEIRRSMRNRGAATRDLNALRMLCESDSTDVWITFHAAHLWWCRLADTPVQEDEISKYREVQDGWHDRDLKGQMLLTAKFRAIFPSYRHFEALCAV